MQFGVLDQGGISSLPCPYGGTEAAAKSG